MSEKSAITAVEALWSGHATGWTAANTAKSLKEGLRLISSVNPTTLAHADTPCTPCDNHPRGIITDFIRVSTAEPAFPPFDRDFLRSFVEKMDRGGISGLQTISAPGTLRNLRCLRETPFHTQKQWHNGEY
ncbi:hypothetical protein TNCV_4853991 [Trichonephila clavipes]|nr:hypothetical protein TNCV_4853991 [Trichonephila clavipes]